MKTKIYKILSILLAVAVVFSCCVIGFTASAGTPVTKTYFLNANTGNDANNGLTKETAFATYKGAIAKAVADAEAGDYNNAESTVYFIIEANSTTTQWFTSGESAHGSAEHKFKLIATTDGDGKLAFLGPGNCSIELNGPTVFEKCYFDYGRAATGARLGITDSLTINQSAQPRYMAGPVLLGTLNNTVTTATLTKPITFTNNATWLFREVVLGSQLNAIYNADINVVWNTDKAFPYTYVGHTYTTHNFSFGSLNTGYTATYNKNVNFNFKKADDVTFIKGKGDFAFGPDAAVQIINSTGKAINYDATMQAALFGASAQVDTYLINNKSGTTDVLEFTEKAGKFKLKDSTYHVTATPKAGGADIKDINGFLTLPAAGEYDITITKDPVYKDYYISPNGIQITRGTRPADAATKGNPVRSFADATFLMEQDGLTEFDIARVYFESGKTNFWNIESLEDPRNDFTNFYYPIDHVCQVIVDSSDPNEKATISNYWSMTMYGKTTIRNVDFVGTSNDSHFVFNDNDVIIESTASVSVPYVYLWSKEKLVHNRNVNVRIEGGFKTKGIRLFASYFNHTMNGDFNIYVNNAKAQVPIEFGYGSSASDPSIYNGNVNVIAKNAETLGIVAKPETATVNGAIQIIADGDFTTPYSFKKNFEEITTAGGKWLITNIAEDDDFVEFTDEKGKFNVKGGATAYSRQLDKDLVTHTGGVIDLSATPGVYTVSDKSIDPLVDDSHKMLYFYTAGNVHRIVSQTWLAPGETYVYEYSMYCNNFDELKLLMGHPDSDGAQTEDFKIVEKTQVGNYYKVKAELNVPADYAKNFAHIGFSMPAYTEGVLFDRVFYLKSDPDKKDLTVENQKFYDGLDGVKFDNSFWGNIFSGDKGGKGITNWTDGIQILQIVNFDTAYIDELIRLANPDDGEWWKEEDIADDEIPVTYAKAKGVFKDSDGNPVKNATMQLVSFDNTYEAVTNENGEFDFGTIVTGFYDLYVLDGEDQLSTFVSAFFEDGDVITFTVVSDISELKPTGGNDGSTNGDNMPSIPDNNIPENNDSTDDTDENLNNVPSDNVDNDSNTSEDLNTGDINNDTNFGDNSNDGSVGDISTDSNTGNNSDYQTVVDGDNVEEIVPSGNLSGTVYTPYLDTVANIKLYLRGVGEVITDENGNFAFANVAVGEYDLYTVLDDNSEYVFRKVTIGENQDLSVKLKYDPVIETDGNDTDNGWIVWVIIASVVALVVVAGVIFLVVFKKKKVA